jgi:prepilin-type N-terminal cleavage/methylation domain-containing protein
MKKAFTMIELVFVIVVIGILAAIVIPRVGSNRLAEAAVQLVSHIRYTQHLAMIDDKFDTADTTWYEKRWQIIFGTSAYTNSKPAYTIFSDTSGTGEPDKSEMAKNPLDSTRVLSGGYSGILHTTNDADEVTKEMNLGYYGITGYNLTGGCSGARVSFDHLGRPFRGDLSSMSGAYSAGTQRLIIQTCNVVLTSSEGTVTIAIEPETGYAHIL